MSFFIYENWQAGPHKAVLHAGACGHCNDGRGHTGNYDPKHAEWHGPYTTFEKARSAQKELKVELRKECPCIGKHL